MGDLILPRRGVLLGLGALIAAPAVCKADWLMPIFGDKRYRYTFSWWQRVDGKWDHSPNIEILSMTEVEAAFYTPAMSPKSEIWMSDLDGGPRSFIQTEAGLLIENYPVLRRSLAVA